MITLTMCIKAHTRCANNSFVKTWVIILMLFVPLARVNAAYRRLTLVDWYFGSSRDATGGRNRGGDNPLKTHKDCKTVPSQLSALSAL